MQYAASPLRSPIERLFNTCNQLLARFTDTSNICVSKAVRAHLQEHFFLRKPHILYNSIGNNLVDSSLALAHVQSKSLPLNGNTFTLVVPGRLHPSKGHAFFLTVLQAFLQETPLDPAQLQVFFVGGGLLHQALSAEIQQKQLEKHVHLTGTVPNPLLLSFLTLADVTIIPSIHEGLGIVAIEALQQQCLVLCSDAGGLPEVIVNHQNGFIAPSLDHAAWLAQLSHLYHNRHKTLISPTTLYNTYKNRFSFPQHLQRLIELISL